MWIPLEMNQGRGSFLVKLQTPSKSRFTKVYHVLNSWFCFDPVLINYDGLMGGISIFFLLFLLCISALGT